MISAVLLTHNNSSTIKETIHCLSWCNEILVIDDNSTDDTQELARQMGARALTRTLDGDFAAQRNFALTEVKSPWVLFVDSDERISTELAQEIQHTISGTTKNGFFLKRKDYLYGHPLKYGETNSVRLLRLAKKDSGIWKRTIHEVWDIHGETGELQYPIDHFPHQTLHEFITDINSYSTLNAKEFISTNRRVTVFDIILYPSGKFFQNYIVRSGFRDGMPGFILALMMSFHSFLTRGKVYLLRHNK